MRKEKKPKTLWRAFGLVSGLTAISRLCGFLRDIVFAHYLGAGAASDAFLVAFKLPNFFRRLTAEGALTHAFLPVFSEVRTKKGEMPALILASEIQIILLLGLSMIVLVMEIGMPLIIGGLAPGFDQDSDTFNAAVQMARLTMPYLPMISLVALWAAILNSLDDYVSGAAAPIIMNIMLIGGAMSIPVLTPILEPILDLGGANLGLPVAAAVLLAGVGQIMMMQHRLRRARVQLKWGQWGGGWQGKFLNMKNLKRKKYAQESQKIWKNFIPAALGAGATQINLLVDLILASLLGTGAISWLYYADRIAQLPLGLIGVALSTALLPRLSAMKAQQKQAAFETDLTIGCALACALIMPAMMALLVMPYAIISGLFQSGAFLASDAQAAAWALMAYAVGLPAFVGLKLTSPALYALDKGRFLLKIALIMVGLNLILSVGLMQVIGHVGLALATGMVAWIGFVWQMGWLMRMHYIGRKSVLWLGRMAGKIFICAGFMGGCLYGGQIWGGQILGEQFFEGTILGLAGLVMLGLVSYGGAVAVSGIRHEMKNMPREYEAASPPPPKTQKTNTKNKVKKQGEKIKKT